MSLRVGLPVLRGTRGRDRAPRKGRGARPRAPSRHRRARGLIMRDLSARLRDIVRQNPRRELTYVPGDAVGEIDARSLAETLGGRAVGGDGACVELDRVYASDRSYGRRCVDAWRPASGAPLHLIDPRAVSVPEW